MYIAVSLKKIQDEKNIFLKIQKRNNVPLIITDTVQNRVNGHRIKLKKKPSTNLIFWWMDPIPVPEAKNVQICVFIPRHDIHVTSFCTII